MSVKERVKIFLSDSEMTVTAFEKSIKASNGYVNSISKSIGVDKLEQIIENYPNLNIEWLLAGKGEMLRSREASAGVLAENTRLKAENTQLKEKINALNELKALQQDLIASLKAQLGEQSGDEKESAAS